LEQLIQSHPLVHDQHEFRLVYQALNHILGMELQAVLEKHLGSLSHLAKDLGKSSPNVIFSGDHCLIPNAFQQVLQDVFGHLFTNSMDHGIESKDERLAKGKNPAGTISVSQRKTGNDLMIRYWDDGRGLNLSKLREIALKKGLLSSADELSEPDLAQLIFTSGFSTANEVTLTSGRGVGMDAIRRLLSEINSDIDLKLRELLDPETRCYSFAFEICIRFHTQVFSDHARSA
jgi:chemotaxis protein histidine kinase CheA